MSVYRVVAGASDAAVILHVPHASRELTAEARRGIRLDDAALADELDRMTDAYTDVIAERAAGLAGTRPWLFINRYSRLVVDPERFPDEREEMARVGMGAVYTRTSGGAVLREEDPALAERLVAAHFRPYARAMAAVVDERLAATGRAVIIDVHSYPTEALPYELHPDSPRPHVCLGTDGYHTPPGLREAAAGAFAGHGTIADNTPFAGCYVPLRHYGTVPSVTALMVEIRRDTYLSAAGRPGPGLDAVSAALARLADAAQSDAARSDAAQSGAAQSGAAG